MRPGIHVGAFWIGVIRSLDLMGSFDYLEIETRNDMRRDGNR